jgi:OsmC-like protein
VIAFLPWRNHRVKNDHSHRRAFRTAASHLNRPAPLVADEATEAASNDEGPDPYEYLLASLGASTNMTLRRYASHKGWPFKQIETTLSHSKSCAVDCEQCEQPAAMIERIDRRITLIDVGSPAPQWSATNNCADHSVDGRQTGLRPECCWNDCLTRKIRSDRTCFPNWTMVLAILCINWA